MMKADDGEIGAGSRISYEGANFMARLGLCDLVLPDLSDAQSDNMDTFKSPSTSDAEDVEDSVPTPSAGGERKGEKKHGERDSKKKRFLARKATLTRMRFKEVVRSVIRAQRWKIPIGRELSIEHLSRSGNDSLRFNANAFKAGSSGTAGLSNRARFILMKAPWERTDEELELVYGIVNKMNCFSKYSNLVRKELSRVIHFETFEEGRVIMREGQYGFSMYFIVSGSVTVQVVQVDERTGERKNHVVGDIPAGSSFGELALIQETKRTATIVCKGSSQFLRVDKADFDIVLKRSYDQEWQERHGVMRSLPFFQNWSQVDIRHITLNSKMVEYLPNSVVTGNTTESPEYVYFVVTGSCVVVRQVVVMQTTSHLKKGQTMLSLPPAGSSPPARSKSRHLAKRFLIVGNLERGDFFSVGEDLSKSCIVTQTKAECLVIPRRALLALERGGGSMRNFSTRNMIKQANAQMMTEEETFDRWMANLRWRNYKKKILMGVIAKKPMRFVRPTKRYTYMETFQPQIAEQVSNLGYPLADAAVKTLQLQRRSGYQLREDLRLPPIHSDRKRKSPKRESTLRKTSDEENQNLDQSALKFRSQSMARSRAMSRMVGGSDDTADWMQHGTSDKLTGISRSLQQLVQ